MPIWPVFHISAILRSHLLYAQDMAQFRLGVGCCIDTWDPDKTWMMSLSLQTRHLSAMLPDDSCVPGSRWCTIVCKWCPALLRSPAHTHHRTANCKHSILCSAQAQLLNIQTFSRPSRKSGPYKLPVFTKQSAWYWTSLTSPIHCSWQGKYSLLFKRISSATARIRLN